MFPFFSLSASQLHNLQITNSCGQTDVVLVGGSQAHDDLVIVLSTRVESHGSHTAENRLFRSLGIGLAADCRPFGEVMRIETS